MKKIIVLTTLLIMGLSRYGFSQNAQVLQAYYGLKDALVADNSTAASTKATELIKALSASDVKIEQKDSNELLKYATHISEKKDIKHQREHFDALSTTMISLAKTAKLSGQLVYVMYCPMKKSSWISGEKAIKNPYYGKSMLTCGTVTQTLN